MRSSRQSRGDGHTLHLPARQAGRHALAVTGHADQFKHVIDATVHGFGVNASVFQGEGDLILYEGAEQLGFRILLHVSDVLGKLRDRVSGGVHAVDHDGAAHRAIGKIGDDAGQRHAQRGFSGSRRADDAYERAGRNIEVDMPQTLDGLTPVR